MWVELNTCSKQGHEKKEATQFQTLTQQCYVLTSVLDFQSLRSSLDTLSLCEMKSVICLRECWWLKHAVLTCTRLTELFCIPATSAQNGNVSNVTQSLNVGWLFKVGFQLHACHRHAIIWTFCLKIPAGKLLSTNSNTVIPAIKWATADS